MADWRSPVDEAAANAIELDADHPIHLDRRVFSYLMLRARRFDDPQARDLALALARRISSMIPRRKPQSTSSKEQ